MQAGYVGPQIYRGGRDSGIFFLISTVPEGETVSMKAGESNNEKGKPFSFNIIVNGRPKKVDYEEITYAQVVALAFPDDPKADQFLYSVQYMGPHTPDGTLAPGQSVPLVNGLKFDVSKTNRS